MLTTAFATLWLISLVVVTAMVFGLALRLALWGGDEFARAWKGGSAPESLGGRMPTKNARPECGLKPT